MPLDCTTLGMLTGFVICIAWFPLGVFLLIKSSDKTTRKLDLLLGKGAIAWLLYLLLWPLCLALAVLCCEKSLDTTSHDD